MCFFMAQNQPMKKVEEWFNAKVDNPDEFLQSDYIVGFDYKNVPIITNEKPKIISTDYHWGLVPSWSKDINFRKNTLNARIETIEEKPSFRNIGSNRCLVIASSYFEWRWLDEKGKQKQKYQIHNCDSEIFAFAGLYDSWIDKVSGEIYHSFSIVTTEADQQMKYIHNHKGRMPIMLNIGDESSWLDFNNSVDEFSFPKYQPRQIGFKV
ncbi:SOS response-associated peptidase [Flavobacterium sedimenticola]|uniref:Abasic site processing protein n=1 Tax=Flavobacterium sedimenticola TaxID=3043286 RepID=A0ABT6XQN9_9FLAO|nr:SOS response-associated peptidase [Flavobacterium sedimenticola]MDI9257302.1 SOS response-associated peptidase [Flavobacterium sedimenticola]